MIALLLAIQAASGQAASGIDGSPLGPIARQQLPATGCAVFLWSAGERRELVAMASAEPARLRVTIDGRAVDLARAEQQGVVSFGFSGTTRYRTAGVEVALDMAIVMDPALTQGGTVPSAALTLSRPGRDSVVLPVAGLIGCAGATPGH
ncbi:hypothetical protein [Sphingomonas bacterium]|uniref:hypothetical protein n=1 Tax=Sphingomonas bacterium TaxID=1895847 RepID=UPI001575CDEE|nr:hypothetical protein [Sphingomonas bacterium]